MNHQLASAARMLTTLVTAVALASALSFGTARAAGEVGSVAPNFTVTNLLAGPTTVTLSDYADSVVCISFFAEW